MKNFALSLLLAGLFAAAPAATVAQDDADSCTFLLSGAAREAQDPQNADNDVISINTTGGAVGTVSLDLPADVQASELTNELSLRYLFINRTCAGGSPRLQLAIDTDGDGDFDHNAFGYVGSQPFGSGCTTGAWTDQNMTDDVARWDLSQLGGSQAMTWAQVLEFFNLPQFSNYQILSVTLVDDSASFAPGASGQAYYDQLVFGDCIYTDHDDSVLAPPTNKDQCKDGGWRIFDNPSFRNQGECVSFVASNGKARANRQSTGRGKQ
ncbi:MAG TPA: hypothetical protein VK421_09610 [Pyrinomonadaceae bacterium]|nr:hypothetical protein [Pyrinomonadaceae bacterium]